MPSVTEERTRAMDSADRFETALNVSNQLSANNDAHRDGPNTGVVERIYTETTEDASVKSLREATRRNGDSAVFESDAGVREWVVHSQHDKLVLIDVELYESNESLTLAWFQADFPREDITKLAGINSLENIIHRNLPLVFDGPLATLVESTSPGRWRRYDAMLKMSDIDDEQLEAFILIPVLGFIILTMGFATAASTLLAVGVVLGLGAIEYAALSAWWPTDILYGRDLKPDWLR